MARAESGSATSTRIDSADPPADTMPAATPAALSSAMSATITAAPAAARPSAYACPMPPPDPVTMATLPVKSNRTIGAGPADSSLTTPRPGCVGR